MPERPPADGSGPDYGWMYGDQPTQDPDATRAIPRQRPDDDATRVVPRQQPAPAQRRPVPVQPAPPPVGPSGPSGPAVSGRGRRRPRFRLRYLLVLLVLWLVFLLAVPFFAWTRVDKVAFEPEGERPGEQPGTTYLLVGSDSRGDLTEAERKELGTGDAEGQRTDTILLLHTGSGPNLLMSVPRDSIVDVPGRGENKINAAFAFGGPELLVQTIESETGIRVDEYVEIGFGGFAGIVDAVGGIQICPTEAMKDPLAKLDVAKGCQQADGPTALGYARSRKLSSLGDIDRARRQREVISAIGSQVVSPWTIVNPFRWWGTNTAAADAVAVGEGMSPLRAGLWASAMTRVNGENGLTCGVPIADLAVNWDPERAPRMFEAIIDDDTASIGKQLCSPTGVAAP